MYGQSSSPKAESVVFLRRVLMIGLIGALLLPLGPAAAKADWPVDMIQVETETPEALVLTFTLPDFDLETITARGQTFVRPRVRGMASGAEPGKPELPYTGVLVGIPPAGSFSWQILDIEQKVISLSEPIVPAPGPVFPEVAYELGSMSTGLAEICAGECEPDASIYTQDELYPASPIELVEAGWIRDDRVARLVFQPVQYNPVRGELLVAHKLTLQVRFETPIPSDPGAAHSGAFDDVMRKALINYETARKWRTGRPLPALTTLLPFQNTQQGRYKVLVGADGLYQLTRADLLSAGIPVQNIDPRTLQLFEQGHEVAIQVIGQNDGVLDPGDSIVFYGHVPRSRYTDHNVYWLDWGQENGLRIAPRDVTPGMLPLDPVWTRSVYRENHYYDSLWPAADQDHWYAVDLRPGREEIISLALAHAPSLAGTTMLHVRMVGYTQSPAVSPDHHAVFTFNDHPVGEYWWDGKGPVTATLSLDSALLQPGENTLAIRLPGDTSAPVEGTWLDEVELHYPCQDATDGELVFWAREGAYRHEIGGFQSDDIELYDVTDPRQPVELTGSTLARDNGYVLAFQDDRPQPSVYLAAVRTRMRAPLAIQVDQPSSLHDETNSADYLIITHADFKDALQPLVAYRQAQGLSVFVADVEDVYDEFSGGLLAPAAIQAFIAYAYLHWNSPPPTYILLVGDGSYDFHDYYGYGSKNYVPPYLGMVDPWWGETAADNRYATVYGDDPLPDVLLGRLPVTTADEARAVVQKIVSYERSPFLGEWNARHVFVADDADVGGSFAAQADAIQDAFIKPPWIGHKIYLDDLDIQTAQSETLTAWQQGALLVSFVGHSSWHQWTAENLFDIQDVPGLQNDRRWPVVLSMTCFTGFYHHPEYATLDESLLRLDGGGAVATWSPSGLGSSQGHERLHMGFYEAVLADGQTGLGLATLAGKLALYQYTHAYNDLLDTYHLFGDPAMALNLTIRPWPYSVYLPVQ